ncbi:MAG: hypothetical protein ACTH34_03085, partial [Microbacterium gubbeenense]|uniref:hypothetical protein n=1 Tax=Microbacterium gubbeenense TaxID=159896 RepID=UPI003F9B1D47
MAPPTSVSSLSTETVSYLSAGNSITADPTGTCNQAADSGTYLPATRWGEFQLSGWDNGFIIKTQAMMSSVASFFFYLGDLAWKALFFLTNFGVTFHPLCTTAMSINSIVGDLAIVGAWFLVPAFLFWLAKNRKDLSSAGRRHRVIGSVLTFSFMFAGLFFIADKSEAVDGKTNEEILNTVGTVPWMANSLNRPDFRSVLQARMEHDE